LIWLARRSMGALRYATLSYDGGRSRVRIDLRSHFGFTTYVYGVEDPDLALVGSLLAPGDLFIDGGAHVGLFTLVAAARVGPAGKVLAFEPAPAARRQLMQNLALSRFPWVEVSACALAECAGARDFVAFSNDAWGSSSFAPPPEFGGGCVEAVPMTTLDAATSELDRSRIRVVKLDVEGAEYAALRGAQRLMREAQPDFLVELEPEHLARQGTSAGDIVSLFREHGYQFFRTEENEKGGVVLTPEANPGKGGERPNVFVTRDLDRVAGAAIAMRER
jgi:FkbM family methyltransferase